MQTPDPLHPGAEALRGVAALMVLATHYVALVQPQGPGLWGLAATGVDLFFVLSGFVFAKLLARPGWSLAAYGVRRLFRLYPLYLVALLVYGWLRPADGRWDALPAHLAMLHTTGSLQLAGAYNVAFWSLPPEVEFYLLLPLLAWLAVAMRHQVQAALWPLLGAALAVKVGLVALADLGESPESLRRVLTVHAPGLLVEFLLGAGVAVVGGHVDAPQWARPWSMRTRRIAAVLGLLALVVLAMVYAQQLSTPEQVARAPLWLQGHVGLWAAVGFAASMLLLKPAAAFAPAESAHTDAGHRLGWALALWAGRCSYGVYLLHNAAPALVARLWPSAQGWPLLMASLALTFVMAAVLHRVVEAPARQWGRRWAARLDQRQAPPTAPR